MNLLFAPPAGMMRYLVGIFPGARARTPGAFQRPKPLLAEKIPKAVS
jgi:hypothetical protein